MRFSKRALVLLSCLAGASVAESPHQKALEDSVDSVLNLDLDKGIEQARKLTEDQPQFQLAHLLQANLLRIKAGQKPGEAIQNSPYFADAPLHLQQEFNARLNRDHEIDPANYLPAEIIHLDSEYQHIMVADLERLRLYVYENRIDGLHFANEYILSIGKKGAGKQVANDLKTPLGVYYLSRYLPEQELPDLYGLGAFTMNYPNYWDRQNGRTGSGIWLHGTSFETYSRGPYSSRGCLTLTNDSFDDIKSYVQLGRTPVVIGKPINWVSKSQWQRQNAFQQHFDSWLQSRRQGNIQQLQRHYTKDFIAKEWSHHKPRYQSSGHRVRVEQLSLLKHPQDEIVLATFSDASGRLRRHVRQYWQQQNNEWKIIYESEVRSPAVVAQKHKAHQRASAGSSTTLR